MCCLWCSCSSCCHFSHPRAQLHTTAADNKHYYHLKIGWRAQVLQLRTERRYVDRFEVRFDVNEGIQCTKCPIQLVHRGVCNRAIDPVYRRAEKLPLQISSSLRCGTCHARKESLRLLRFETQLGRSSLSSELIESPALVSPSLGTLSSLVLPPPSVRRNLPWEGVLFPSSSCCLFTLDLTAALHSTSLDNNPRSEVDAATTTF